ncbi:hypothetical protein EG831_08220, partial [bacterium]|nr:hypothetical protein [bacterium]
MAPIVQRGFADAGQFRAWLAANHATVTVLWLVFFKKHACRESISYEDAVRQALCYGWIDSIVKRLDDDRCLRKFTPRTNRAKWSRSNIERAIELIRSRRMTAAGYAVLPSRNVEELKRYTAVQRPVISRTPPFILAGLRRDPQARTRFAALPPSQRRSFV